MSQGPTIREQMQNAIDLVRVAQRWEADEISEEEFHQLIIDAGAKVGGMVQLADGLVAFGGSMVVALAGLTGRTFDETLANVEQSNRTMPGLDQ